MYVPEMIIRITSENVHVKSQQGSSAAACSFCPGGAVTQYSYRGISALYEWSSLSFMCSSWLHLEWWYPGHLGRGGQVENAEVRKPKYGNGSMETEVQK